MRLQRRETQVRFGAFRFGSSVVFPRVTRPSPSQVNLNATCAHNKVDIQNLGASINDSSGSWYLTKPVQKINKRSLCVCVTSDHHLLASQRLGTLMMISFTWDSGNPGLSAEA